MNRINQILSFLEQSPNDQFLHHALALEYVKLGDQALALATFRKNIAISENYVATYYHMGQLLDKMGQTDEAIAIYEKGMAVAKAAGDAHAFGELRSVYEELTF